MKDEMKDGKLVKLLSKVYQVPMKEIDGILKELEVGTDAGIEHLKKVLYCRDRVKTFAWERRIGLKR